MMPNVVVVLCSCSHLHKQFGIRFEESETGQWIGDWAFPLTEDTAKREGYDRGEITGEFEFGSDYPGRPHCEATSLFKCSCGGVACWDGESQTVTCPWCGNSGELNGIITSLDAGLDR